MNKVSVKTLLLESGLIRWTIAVVIYTIWVLYQIWNRAVINSDEIDIKYMIAIMVSPVSNSPAVDIPYDWGTCLCCPLVCLPVSLHGRAHRGDSHSSVPVLGGCKTRGAKGMDLPGICCKYVFISVHLSIPWSAGLLTALFSLYVDASLLAHNKSLTIN